MIIDGSLYNVFTDIHLLYLHPPNITPQSRAVHGQLQMRGIIHSSPVMTSMTDKGCKTC